MYSTSEFESFAARLRRLFEASHDPQAVAASLFEELAFELFALQFDANPDYQRFCRARGVTPQGLGDWREIPAVPTSVFKELQLSCLPMEERKYFFQSSGTTAQKRSRHYHNDRSLALYGESALAWFAVNSLLPIANRQLPIANGRMVILTPSPRQAPHSSLVHMFEAIRRQWEAVPGAYFGRAEEDGAWTVELETAAGFLQDACAARQPVQLFGTAFSYVHLLDYLSARGIALPLPKGSWALETGGYKGRSRSMPKEELHESIGQWLNIPANRILCEYGMSELSSQAYSSRITHHASSSFRFSPWARVQIISPETGCEVDEGETGLIRVFDLANLYSVMAIQTEDLGVREADGFTLLGRTVLAERRGCSLMAV